MTPTLLASIQLEQTGRQPSGALLSTKKDGKGSRTEHWRAALPKTHTRKKYSLFFPPQCPSYAMTEGFAGLGPKKQSSPEKQGKLKQGHSYPANTSADNWHGTAFSKAPKPCLGTSPDPNRCKLLSITSLQKFPLGLKVTLATHDSNLLFLGLYNGNPVKTDSRGRQTFPCMGACWFVEMLLSRLVLGTPAVLGTTPAQ